MSDIPDFGPVPQGVETPAVLVDATRLAANIARVAAIGHRAGVAVRPHIKTHKSIEIARMQMLAGAVGITASKCDEALVFINAGLPSVTCAYPIADPRKLDRLLAGAEAAGCDLRLMADSEALVVALEDAAGRLGRIIPVYLKIDVGLHRCGLEVEAPALPLLATRIEAAPWLALAGILSHAGQAYGATDASGARAVAHDEAVLMRRAKARIEAAGVPVPEVSVGSTPTVLASDDYAGITEIRPGNYVFMDRTPIRLGLCAASETALTVLATVVAVNAQFIIVDAGSKVLSSDGGAHGALGAGGFGLAWPVRGGGSLPVARLSEEHGWLERGKANLSVGDVVRILPNHACVVANLASVLLLVDAAGGAQPLRVDARGRTL